MLQKTGLISKDQIEKILKATDIVQLIGGYIQLRASGKNYLGLCPFHHEKTPSFVVSPAYQNYKCYGCNAHGDAIRFVMEKENFQFPEAALFLAERNGIEIKKTLSSFPVSNHFDELHQCIQETQKFYSSNLVNAPESSLIRKYLKQRKISEDSIRMFQLGFAKPGWTNLSDYLKTKSIDISAQERGGLVKKGEKGSYYDRLRNRLIFPIKDIQKRILGFAGRTIDNEDPKYLNPPETELYKKSTVLYGICEAAEKIRKTQRAIVVEGYLDAIRLHEHQWTETVATCGTALTADHLKSLKRVGAKEIILLFDGDAAGIKAAERTARIFIENDIDSKVIVLPEKMDPDDYFKKYGSDDFLKLLDQSINDYEFIILQAKKLTFGQGISYQQTIISELSELSNRIISSIKRELFQENISKAFGIAKKELQKTVSAKTQISSIDSPQKTDISWKLLHENHFPEIRFLKYLMEHAEAIKLARESVSADDFVDQRLSIIYSRFLKLKDEEFVSLKPNDFLDLFAEFNNLIMQILHITTEYKGPTVIRRSSNEMQKLQMGNSSITNTYSTEAFRNLIIKLKDHKQTRLKKQLHYSPHDQARTDLMRIVQERKQSGFVDEINAINKS